MRTIFRILLFVMISVSAFTATIWKDRDVYSPDTELQVGDIVIVNVNDFSKMKFDISLKNNSSSDVLSNPDMTITGFLPKISSNKNIKNNDSTGFSGNSNITLSVAARVTARQNNGYTAINGVRVYTFNGVTNTVQITGIIDPKLIKGGSVSSEHIADFRIQISGRKEGLTIRKGAPAEGEKAVTELNEQEKQQIIVDYLEKMIRELTR